MQVARLGGVMSKARNIWLDHPMLKQVTTYFVDQLDGLTLQGRTRLLVVDAVSDAVVAHQAVEVCQSFDSDNSEAFFAYMKGLLLSVSELGRWVYLCGDVRWQVFDEPWLRFSSTGEISVEQCTDPNCVTDLYTHLAAEFGAPALGVAAARKSPNVKSAKESTCQS